MPKLMSTTDDVQLTASAGGSHFQFSGVKLENLGATEYTISTMIVDTTGSVDSFANELLAATKMIVETCRRSPRVDNLLLRLTTFNEHVTEVHGFKPLADIDPDQYEPYEPTGMTALYDATLDGVAATIHYANMLVQQGFSCNAIVWVVTDGIDNSSRNARPADIAKAVREARQGEALESILVVLVAINLQDPDSQVYLERFRDQAKLDGFIDIGEATPDKLAYMADFISSSIIKQSQALGSGVSTTI